MKISQVFEFSTELTQSQKRNNLASKLQKFLEQKKRVEMRKSFSIDTNKGILAITAQMLTRIRNTAILNVKDSQLFSV